MPDTSIWRDVRVRVAVGSIATLVAAAAVWLPGWWPSVRHAISGAAGAIWGALSYSTPTPVSVLVALVLAIAILTRLLQQAREGTPRQPRTGSAPRAAVPRQAPSRFQPDDVQEGVLRILAELDGEPVHPALLPVRLKVGVLILDKALRGLETRRLIWRHSAGFGGIDGVGLTPNGRDFVIAAGFARQEPRGR